MKEDTSFYSLEGKRVWVIGGAGYLGQATVRLLGKAGAQVVCVDVHDRAQQFVSGEKLTNTTAATFDINDTEQVPAFVQALIAEHGTPDGLVNLAFGSTAKKLEDLTADDFDRVNHAGLTATFIFARETAGHMIAKGGGSIVLFSSMYGMVSPHPDVYAAPMNKNPVEYGTGKAGVIQMTKYLSVHWAKQGVRVNCISPGPFPNPGVQQQYPDFIERLAMQSPMGRVGSAKEIAGPVAFLLSDAAGYITGHNLVVDGGWTSW